MLVHLTLVLLLNLITMNFTIKGLIMYILVMGLFRLKYGVNYGFQRSINEIHLLYDKLSKRLMFRNCYQQCYKFLVRISLISDYN